MANSLLKPQVLKKGVDDKLRYVWALPCSPAILTSFITTEFIENSILMKKLPAPKPSAKIYPEIVNCRKRSQIIIFCVDSKK